MYVDLVITSLGALFLVIAVVSANPRRPQNQAFGLLGGVALGWLTAIQLAFGASSLAWISFWISTCSAIASFVPASVLVLRGTIRGATLRQALGQKKGWLLSAVAVAIYCYTPLYIAGADWPAQPGMIPEHLPGSLFFLYPVYMMAGLAVAFALSLRDALVLRDLARVESGFLAVAVAVQVFLGIVLSSALPYIVGSFQSTRYSYIWVLSMVVIAAYGISANRLMSPSRGLQQTCAYLIAALLAGGLYLILRLAGETVLGIQYEAVWELVPGVAVVVALLFFGKQLIGWASHLVSLFPQKMEAGRLIQELDATSARIVSLEDLTEKVESVLSERTGSMGVTLFHRQGEVFHGKWQGSCLVLEADDIWLRHLAQVREPLSVDILKRQGSSVAEQEILERLQELNLSAALPVVGEAGLIGVVALEPRYTGEIYETAELEALAILASHLAVALDNARLFSEVLKEREQSARLAESINHGLIACDRGGQIVQFNRKAREVLSGERGPTLRDIPPELSRLLRDALDGNTCHRQRVEVSGRHFRADSGQYQNQAGAELGAYLMLEDITERVRLEKRLMELSDQVHDMKVPMSAIRIFAELLPQKYQDEAFRDEFGPIIVQEVDRLDGILHDMGRRGTPAVDRSLDLVSLARAELVQLTLVAESQGVELVHELPSASCDLALDSVAASRLLVNPVQNALESLRESGKGSRIWVRLQVEKLARGRRIRYEVEDDGPGLPPDMQAEVWEAGVTTRREAGGTGLGLSQIAAISAPLGVTPTLTQGKAGGALFRWEYLEPLPEKKHEP